MKLCAVCETRQCILFAACVLCFKFGILLGGSLLLAGGGVCVIMNLSSYKKDTREILWRG